MPHQPPPPSREFQSISGYYESLPKQKLFQFDLVNSKLVSIKLFHTSGSLLSESLLSDGHLTSCKTYNAPPDPPTQAQTPTLTLNLNLKKLLFDAEIYHPQTQKLIYKGEYFDNMKNGYGVEYSADNVAILQGTWKNDKLTGNGIKFYPNGHKEYEGTYFDGMKQGQGTLYHEENIIRYSASSRLLSENAGKGLQR